MNTTSRLLLVVGVLVVSLLPIAPPRARAQGGNLVSNGNFESGNLDLWDVCGGVRLADTQAGASALHVHEGRYALRIGNPSRRECDGGEFFASQLQAFYDGIVVPSDASGLTLSFWYNRTGTFGEGSASWALNMVFATEDEPRVSISDAIFPDTTSGWNLARFELSADQLAQARGRTFYLYFDVVFSLGEDSNLAYYIDEISVVPRRVRTPTGGATPPALRDTNTQPLVGLGAPGGELRTVRADLDGSDVRSIFEGAQQNGGDQPRWSPDGSRIAVLEHIFQPEPGQPISINSAQVTTLNIMDAQGDNAREVFRTTGKKLVPGTPPGCRPPRTDCAPYDDPALDVLIVDHAWSPDGGEIALNICSWNRYGDGYRTDPLCRIQILDPESGALRLDIKPATGVDWSADNRLLYNVGIEGPLVYDVPQGIYEADLNITPLAPRLLFSHRLPITEDAGAAWAPDGERFVTVRFVEGFHYDDQGVYQFNAAVMLFDRMEPDNPRQLVLVDWGRSIGSPTWSPDGRYVLFNVVIGDEGSQTWWVDVTTGQTKLLTGNIVDVDWRPTRTVVFTNAIHLPMVRR